MHEMRRLVAIISVLIGAIFLAAGGLVSLTICLELKDQGISALSVAALRSQMTEPILWGSVLLALGGLLLFDGVRELTTRFRDEKSN